MTIDTRAKNTSDRTASKAPLTMDYSVEPLHSASLIVRAREPFNAEPSVVALVQHRITPEELVYCRNHSPTVPLDKDTFTLQVGGEVEKALSFTLAELKQSFPRAEVVAALQCAGNRRKTMADRSGKKVSGINWVEGAICNCRWAGVRLRDVLLRAGLKMGAESSKEMYASFMSRITPSQDDERGYGASIELSKALDENRDVLIAYEMNGQPLSVDRGAPFRLVLPGYSGMRWVKWLDTITVGPYQLDNFYQQRDYKILPPAVRSHAQADCEGWWSKVPALTATPLNSVVASLDLQATTPPPGGSPPSQTSVLARGYALRGPSGGQVCAVEVSADGGRSWQAARITYREGRWSWTLWEAMLVLDSASAGAGAERTILSRATNESGETQAAECDWNLRGVAYCGYGSATF